MMQTGRRKLIEHELILVKFTSIGQESLLSVRRDMFLPKLNTENQLV